MDVMTELESEVVDLKVGGIDIGVGGLKKMTGLRFLAYLAELEYLTDLVGLKELDRLSKFFASS